MMTYMTKAEYRAAKTRLTKGLNAVKRAESDSAKLEAAMRLRDLTDLQLKVWDAGEQVAPDDWHRWQIANDDAAMMVARLERGLWI